MSWSWTLYRYLAEQFLFGVAIVYCVFLMLAFSIDAVDLTNRTAGHGVSTLIVIGMAILQLPDLGLKMLPLKVFGQNWLAKKPARTAVTPTIRPG